MDLQKQNHAAARWYLVGTLAVSVLLTALRCINLFFFFDSDIGYHTSGAVLPTLCTVLLILSIIVLGAVSIVFFRKQSFQYRENATPAVRLLGGVCALGFLSLACLDAMQGGSILAVLFGIGATVYFLTVAINRANPLLQVLTGLCAILRVAMALAGSYFNIYVQMNAPDKLYFLLGCIGGMLFLVCELRATVSSARPILYRFSASCGILLTAIASLPSVLATFADRLENDGELPARVVLFFLCLYMTARLFEVTIQPAVEEAIEEMEITEEAEETEGIPSADHNDNDDNEGNDDKNDKEEQA